MAMSTFSFPFYIGQRVAVDALRGKVEALMQEDNGQQFARVKHAASLHLDADDRINTTVSTWYRIEQIREDTHA